MANIYLDSTTGDDTTGAGTLASPWKTLVKAAAVNVGGDRIILRGGMTYPITTALTFTSTIYMETYIGDSSKATVESTMGGRMLGSAGSATSSFTNLIFLNLTTTIIIDLTGLAASSRLIDCEFYSMIRLGGGTVVAENCIFDPPDISGATTCFATATPALNLLNCFITKPLSSAGTQNPKNHWFRGLVVSFKGKTFNKTHVLNTNAPGFIADSIIFDFCTFSEEIASIIRWNSASNVDSPGICFSRCYIATDNMISNAGAGSLTISTMASGNNIFLPATNQTGFTDYGSTTTSTPKFYDAANSDFRIEYDSPLADYNGDTVGAKILEKPDVFFTSIPEAKVELAHAYRDGARINNKTGSLAAAGETDVNKVLNTSLVISGNVIPVALSSVRSGTAAMLGTGTLAVPTPDKVALGVATDSTTGTRTDADPSKVLISEPTYGGNGTEFTPSYVTSGGSDNFNKKLLTSIIGGRT